MSAVLPSFCQAVTATGTHGTALAAFCGPEERFLSESHVERFPLGKAVWLRDRTVRQRLRSRIESSAGAHIHGLWQEHCAIGAAMARNARKPYVISAHGMLDRWALNNKRWKKLLYCWLVENRNLQGASCLHALTDSEAADYRRTGTRAPVAVIPNGVDVPGSADAEAFLTTFPQLRQKRIVLFLGRLHYKKGLDLLCQAWKEAGLCQDAHLVLAGPDFEGTEANVKALISDLGIAHNITFTGMLR